ncbi:conjugal transfer pilus assembly protein TraU [Pasteurella multocida]|uniref:conjugal transfer pilus assembly protein TraU n=1 Tax=Pasteurella multocida TaxID=747 RepID=UPI001480BE20|nr:conjugal transfer pilus assembly protein TraU [Pasteurella multocida]NNH97762.1 conjugal transfer protein TraU [Pasteurella multocida]NNI42895.1 conjugal transfer protein TraU [Pasteurella multocida]
MKKNKSISALIGLCGLLTSIQVNSSPTCDGKWINPITDVCWSCLFPMSIGSTRVSKGSVPDTRNPSSPIQYCPMPPPIFFRIGVAIGFWEPLAVTDVTRDPMCMVNMGGMKISGLKKRGQGKATKTAVDNTNTFYHVHWYKYPLISWLNIITTASCMQGGEYDIGYLSEIDPMWNDDKLSIFVNPEAALFGNPIAQLACSADALASEFDTSIDALFWCAGAHGSVYPFTGSTSNESSGLNSSVLLTERMNFKLHRQGIILDTVPENKAVCYEYPAPIIPKERYRYQLVNTIADANQCHPYGRSVLRWQNGKELPTTLKNYGYLVWKKRNCVMW